LLTRDGVWQTLLRGKYVSKALSQVFLETWWLTLLGRTYGNKEAFFWPWKFLIKDVILGA
jgi:hypothetical protein